MRRLLTALAVVVTAALLPAVAEDKPAEDEKLLATWELIETRHPAPAEPLPGNGATWSFTKDGKFSIRTKDGKVGVEGTFTTAQGKNFREMNMIPTTGRRKPWLTIYQIDGDNLTVVMANLQDSGRPDDITAKNFGSKMTFKRRQP